METADIRRRFLEHFEKAGHTVVPSASVLLDDPNLLFVNAGMVPFKPYFLGQETPPYDRATSVQKCVRTPDIDDVGKTTRHGTFFQMCGNFSFGDYFKEGAIRLAWDLVTKPVDDGGFGLEVDRLWPSVLNGDDEALGLWMEVTGLPEHRIVKLGLKENYWSMGVPGPGGPCSEILYDRGPAYGPEADWEAMGIEMDPALEDRYLEIWNLVFMQEELGEVRSKTDFDVAGPLPAKNIDTGMGLERVAFLLQGKENLYEIDEVFPVIEKASELSGIAYGANPDSDVRLRIVADHVRSGLMMTGDGVVPGNEGRGYVLRRILRRAVRAMRLLGVEGPTLPALLPVSLAKMAISYPELARDRERIESVVYAEEDQFLRTLAHGTQIFDQAASRAKDAGRTTVTGDDAFKLHDTFGFPLDLTLEMASEEGLSVDEEGFRALMTEQRERAKADAKAKKGQHADTSVYRETLSAVGETDWRALESVAEEANVRRLLTSAGPTREANPGEVVEVVLDRTPFYAEAGGQSADAGTLKWDGGRADVLDVQRPINGLVVHQVRVTDGILHDGVDLEALVDTTWRYGATQAHSATHVIGAALRERLGQTATQSGSFNRPGYLRLDFSWNNALDEEQAAFIEHKANDIIRQDLPVGSAYMPKAAALEMGAQAMFGEKYPDTVRVVEINGPWSLELCGGTHVETTAQIGTMVLTHEGSVSAGNRRVEVVTGFEGFSYLARERDLVRQLSEMLKATPSDLPARVEDLLGRLKQAEKQAERIKAEQLLAGAGTLAADAEDHGGVSLVRARIDGVGGGDLRSLALDVRGRLGNERPAVVMLIGTANDKPSLVVALNPAATDRGLDANAFMQAAASHIGGKGGGKPDIAQGGGSDVSGIDGALASAAEVLASGR